MMGAREELARSTVATDGTAFAGAMKLANNKPVAEQSIIPLRAMSFLPYRSTRRLEQTLTAELRSTDVALHLQGDLSASSCCARVASGHASCCSTNKL